MPAQIDYYTELCLRLYEDSLPVVTGTNTGTNASNILDTAGLLNYSSGDTNFYDGVYARLVGTDDVSSGDSRITRGGWTVTGTLVVDPDFSTTPVSGDLYTLSRHPPKLLDGAINRLLRNTYQPAFFPLSMSVFASDNNDMEASTIADGYTVAAGGAALAAETGSNITVFNGAQVVQSTNNNANEYFALASLVGVNEGQSLYAAAMCYVTQGDDAIFRVIDVTNSSATIDSALSDEPSWMEMVISVSVPSGCEQIDLRMIGVGSDDVVYWDDIQVWRQDSGIYALPSWIEWPEQVIDVRGFPQGTGGPTGSNDYRADEQMSRPLNWHVEREDRRASSPLRIWVQGTSTRPYVYAHRPFAELTTTQATSNADLDAVVEDAAFLVNHPDRAEQYLAVLRQNRLGGAVVVAPTRVGVR